MLRRSTTACQDISKKNVLGLAVEGQTGSTLHQGVAPRYENTGLRLAFLRQKVARLDRLNLRKGRVRLTFSLTRQPAQHSRRYRRHQHPNLYSSPRPGARSEVKLQSELDLSRGAREVSGVASTENPAHRG